MFRNTFHSGFLSILYAVGSNPLQLWDVKAQQDGTVERITDEDIASSAVELRSSNVSTTFVACPSDPQKSLGIRLPFLVLLVKELGEHFSFEVQILDDKGFRRRFRASNFQACTRVSDSITTMPLRLEPGWNQIQFDLADFVTRAYGTKYVETLRIQIHATCRLRRVYFADRAYRQEELPAEFKLFLPTDGGNRKAARIADNSKQQGGLPGGKQDAQGGYEENDKVESAMV